MSNQYDAIIIGTGQSGPALAGRLNSEGLRTAIIERGLVGGTCVNVGCIPTKTLVASARTAYMAREAARFGVQIPGDIAVDMAAVKARKDEISGASNRGVTRWIEGMDNVDLIRGHASFTGPNAVQINGETIESDKIFINVGGRASVPNWKGLAQVPFFTNSSRLKLARPIARPVTRTLSGPLRDTSSPNVLPATENSNSGPLLM